MDDVEAVQVADALEDRSHDPGSLLLAEGLTPRFALLHKLGCDKWMGT